MINLAFLKYFFLKKMIFGNFIYKIIIIEFVVENSQKPMCWDVEEGICTIYVWGILSCWNGKSTSMMSLVLKCDYENTLNFETSVWTQVWQWMDLWRKNLWPNVLWYSNSLMELKGKIDVGKSHNGWKKWNYLGKNKNIKDLWTSWGSSIVQLSWFHPFQKTFSQLHFHPFSNFPNPLKRHFTPTSWQLRVLDQ